MKATFENSVNVLVRAFLNDTLDRYDCKRCAVGNILEAAGAGAIWDKYKEVNWAACRDRLMFDIHKAKEEVFMSGYTLQEISRIESAFMGWRQGDSNLPYFDNFKGLMRTVDELADIHNIDLTAKESAKKLFVKP